METDKCTDRNHILTIDANIAKKFKDPASSIKVRGVLNENELGQGCAKLREG